MKSHPAKNLADCRAISGYIGRKLQTDYTPTEFDDHWDTLLANVDSTGTVQAVAL